MADISGILSKYEREFVERIVIHGFTVKEAYKVAFGVMGELTDQDLKRAYRLSAKKKIKDEIARLRDQEIETQRKIRAGTLEFSREQAMNELRFLFEKCKDALNVTPMENRLWQRIAKILTSEERLIVKPYYDSEADKFVNPPSEDVHLFEEAQWLICRPKMDHKTGELMNKVVRSMSELYNLINTNVTLKADETLDTVVRFMQAQLDGGASVEELRRFASEQDDTNVS